MTMGIQISSVRCLDFPMRKKGVCCGGFPCFSCFRSVVVFVILLVMGFFPRCFNLVLMRTLSSDVKLKCINARLVFRSSLLHGEAEH